jgi:hypothetical protein
MSTKYGSVPTSADGQDHPGASVELRNKQGHSCCLGCCDVRRAVIIVDLVMIFCLAIDIVELVSFSVQQPFDDDELQAAVEAVHGGPSIVIFLIEIALLVVVINGAISFSAEKVAVGLVVFGIGFVSSLCLFNVPSLVITSLFAYPHYYLYQEISSGTMSAENYINEEQSCCCV